jgi:membrane peptidoglycan carboxypeptidase
MNPYGEPQSARARASVPGPSGASTPDEGPGAYRAQARPAGGRASVGSASVGSASVGTAGRASVGSAPVGSASVGSASVGSASVGSASVGSARVGARATVGPPADGARPGTPGRAAVARAAVRPTPGYHGMGELDGPAGGGPGGPGGGGGGRGGRGDKNDPAGKRAKRRRRTNILTAAAAVLVMLLGAGVVGGTYFFDSVDVVQPKTESQPNTIFASDGKTVLAREGAQNRIVVPSEKITDLVRRAVAGAEDKNFYKHGGIDMKGIARAAWNNFSGGDTQGASTITQQYARHAASLKDISYNRKLREAVIARKLESKYEKNDIMGFYLNAIYFGRGAYGIEAAAKAYIGPGKSVVATSGKAALTPSEVAVLAAVIKQPERDVNGGHKGYDPQYNPEAAKERWTYTLNNMLEMKWITPEQRQAAKYPDDNKLLMTPKKVKAPASGSSGAAGIVVRHVNEELASLGIDEDKQAKGGYSITTTIKADVQRAAEEVGSRKSPESPMRKLKATHQSAIVAINPANGAVLGYYGGDDPTGWDYAGMNYQDGKQVGGVSPGSTFKIYTLAAAMDADISFKTRWDGTKEKTTGGKINNAGRATASLCGGKIKFCDLETSTIQSYNFPFYWIAEGLGPDKIVEAAKKAGIRHMWGEGDKLVNLDKTDNKTWEDLFGNEVAFGQYRVLPLEHVNGVATFANNGIYNKAHFVTRVDHRNELTGVNKTVHNFKADNKRVFQTDRMADIDGVLQKIPANSGKSIGRPAIGKTGTWEYVNSKGKTDGNGDAWMVGATPQIAAGVWVGGKDSRVQLKNADGSNMFGSTTPGLLWQKFMKRVTDGMDVERFPDRIQTGDENSKFANGVAPPVVEVPAVPCIPPFCATDPNNGNNGNGNGNGNGNDPDNPTTQPGTDDPGNGDPGNGDPGEGDGEGDGTGGGNGDDNRTFPRNGAD